MGQRTAAVVHRVARAEQPDVNDRELLRRFVGGDQSAFTGLVRRHMPMVLGVCRRVLSNAQDAEDASQATFLVLARKAPADRWQPSIANWLYATARKVARNARVAADRRAKREGRAAVPEAIAPLDQMTGRDLLAVLDEELDRLPPRYREPLVLCYLQGLTRDEAATRLGVPSVTLKSQLDRGRKQLAAALTRRGVALGAGLLALTAASRAELLGPRLVEAVRAAVAGNAPLAVTALAESASFNGLAQQAVLGAALAAAVAAAGLGIGQPRASTADPPEKAMPAKSALKAEPVAKPAGMPIPVSGRVLDPDGKPVAGATFAVIDDETGAPLSKIVSGSDGRFAFELPYPPIVRNPRHVVASAPGFGLDWLSEPRDDAVFRLVPDQPITGRIIDLQGKPVAGATVAVHNVHAGPAGAFDDLLKNWNKSTEELDRTAGKLDRAIFNRGGLGQAFHTRTAADGTFTLSGLGKDRVVTLLVTGPGFADTFADVATRKGVDMSGAGPAAQRMRKTGIGNPVRLFAPDFALVVGPDKPITGIVRDGPTGTPLVGVRVTGASMTGDIGGGPLHFHAWPTPHTTTDKDGRFTLRGLSKAKAYVLVADPEEGTEHLHRFDQVEDTVGFDPIATGFSLPRGVILTGRVTDAKTGEGVASRVFYRPLTKNHELYGGYGPPDYPAPWHRGRDTKTDFGGRYKITVAPGPGVVCFQAYGGDYPRAPRGTQQEIDDGIVDKKFGHFLTVGQGGMFNPEYMHAYKVICPPGTARTATLDVSYQPEGPAKKVPKAVPKPAERPGRAYSGRVVGPDDKPVPGAVVFAFGSEDANPKPATVRTTVGLDGRFRITLPDGQRFASGLFGKADGFGIGRVEPKADTADDLTIRLVADNPVAGRVVTTEGKPAAGVRLTIDRIADDVDDLDQLFAKLKAGSDRDGLGHRRSMPTDRDELGTTAVTEAAGKFRLTGGGKDRILYVDVRGEGIVSSRLTVINRPGFDPEPFNAAARKAGDRFDRSVLYGPDLNIVAEREKVIRGRVTDAATGEPRAGVHVLLTRSRSDLVWPIPDAWTDKDGRYEIRGARKAAAYMVEVSADTTGGYMPCQAWADDTIGYEPATIDLRVKKGVIVTGRLIDKGTGKPVAGFAMIGVPQGNTSAKDYPEFSSSAWFPIQQTDAEGRFRVVSIPGPVLLMGGPNSWEEMAKYKAPVADPKYPQYFQKFGDHTAFIMAGGLISPLQGRFCKVLDIKADAKAVEQDIELAPVEAPKKP